MSHDFSPFYIKHFEIGLSCLSPLSVCYFYPKCLYRVCDVECLFSLPLFFSPRLPSSLNNGTFVIYFRLTIKYIPLIRIESAKYFCDSRKLVSLDVHEKRENIDATIDLTKRKEKKRSANLFFPSTERRTNKSDREEKKQGAEGRFRKGTGQTRGRSRGREVGNGRTPGLLTLFRG